MHLHMCILSGQSGFGTPLRNPSDLEAAGMFAENEVNSPARSFLLRVGLDRWSAMTLDQQLAVWGS
jgi:hypothetical protein